MSPATERYFKNIIARRDRRFDGRFYFGVKTTKIYCRPVCPAKPKPENIVIFKSLGEAETKGYRACLRCHPDLAPGSTFLDGTVNTVSRALRLIHDGSLDEWDVPTLAATLGMTDRHLRRLFDEHLGASPVDILITRRLHLARQLLQETARPVTEIALAAGFKSLRRFNEAFRDRYKKAPSSFRRSAGAVAPETLSLKIPIRLPYDWARVLAYLRRHATYGVERVEEGRYRRFIPRGNAFGSVAVSHGPGDNFLTVEFTGVPLSDVRRVLGRLKNLFDTDHNPAHLPAAAGLIPNGIRVPGAFDPFETAVSIILSQLVSVEQATAKLKQLVQRFGRPIGRDGADEVYAFPAPAALARAPVEKIGMPWARAEAVRGLSRAVADGSIDFAAHADLPASMEKLLGIKGIGPWTAAMIAMRCLGDADAFPAFDLIVRRAVEKKLVDETQWTSARAYLVHCLWRDFGKTLSKRR